MENSLRAATENIHILFVEDEPKFGTNIHKELSEKGYHVDWAYDGRIGESMFRSKQYDLILLDLNLPYINGLDLCRRIRESNKEVPVLILTALGELDDKMEAFAAGADDFLVKPVHMKELLARLQVFQKRHQINQRFDEKIRVGDLELDYSTKSVSRQGKDIPLTAKEFALLSLLMNSVGKVVSKMEIAEKVWGTDLDTGTNTIEVYISFLRNKIDKPFDVKMIQTKAGFGYLIKPA